MYIADEKRYDKMVYNRCGKSGAALNNMDFTEEEMHRIEEILVD